MEEIKEYQAISADVWSVFKKYLPEEVSSAAFADDVHILDQKYDKSPKKRFMQKLLKVYFDELREVRG